MGIVIVYKPGMQPEHGATADQWIETIAEWKDEFPRHETPQPVDPATHYEGKKLFDLEGNPLDGQDPMRMAMVQVLEMSRSINDVSKEMRIIRHIAETALKR